VAADEATRTGLAGMSQIFHVEQVNYALAGTTAYSPLYQTIAEYFETWHALASVGQFDGQGDHHTPKPYVRRAFRKYQECGIFAHDFARARCAAGRCA
jgi:hypothetical protein